MVIFFFYINFIYIYTLNVYIWRLKSQYNQYMSTLFKKIIITIDNRFSFRCIMKQSYTLFIHYLFEYIIYTRLFFLTVQYHRTQNVYSRTLYK